MKITYQEATALDCTDADLQRMGFTKPCEGGWMKPDTDPNTAWDFAKVVQAERGHFQLGVLYSFGETLVRFFEHNKSLGADFFKPTNLKINIYSATRVTSTGKRRDRGYCYL